MLHSSLKRLFLLLLINTLVFIVKAQQPHFVYLQTDNGQPFYVKLNNKIISSSSEGYIILPGITDGEYKIVVGFPKNKFPEENFALTVDKKNEGFLLKNFDDKGWQLFNLQTLALIAGTRNQTVAAANPGKKDLDPFSQMLAGVVKDSSILQNHQPVVPAVSTSANHTDTSSAVASLPPSSVKDTASATTGVASVPAVNPKVTKLLSSQDKDGLQMMYQDKNISGTDTVRIFFPEEKNKTVVDTTSTLIAQNSNINISPVIDSANLSITPTPIQNVTDIAANNSVKKDSSIPSARLAEEPVAIVSPKDSALKVADTSLVKKEDQQQQIPAGQKNEEVTANNHSAALDNQSSVDQQQAPVESHIIVLPTPVTSSRNSDCKDFATDNDFLKLRKKMAEESGNEKMIQVAKKYFKSKCYSTDQIKNLSYIFLTNEAKYEFFEAAYPFVSDSGLFPTLENQFTDSYYLNRFKAMVNK